LYYGVKILLTIHHNKIRTVIKVGSQRIEVGTKVIIKHICS
jgi:hypothetical protein